MNKYIFIIAMILMSTLGHTANSDMFGIGPALGFDESSKGASKSIKDMPSSKMSEPLSFEKPTESPQIFDYAENLRSEVFGTRLFTGAFARQGASFFNPDYIISIGDKIEVRFWGAFEYGAELTVDEQGNVILPHKGPVKVMGVQNKDLQATIEQALKGIYRANVYTYTNLSMAQPVRVFVSGFVHRPGLYNGTSTDSVLHYLDQAGGIDPSRGSFLDVQQKRQNKVIGRINLYDFLLRGNLPSTHLQDGDMIFVNPRQNTVHVSGIAENPNTFEFATEQITLNLLTTYAKPFAQATHMRITRNQGVVRNVEYFPLSASESIVLRNGDELEFIADKKPGTITVRVEGEHLSAQEYVLPYGAKLGQLLENITLTANSDAASLQLYRQSVKTRQKKMLETSLKSLESTALTAKSGTSDEAVLRKEEADLILQWVDRAKKVEPAGQVLIAEAKSIKTLLLEHGDILRIPTKDGLVLVSGEVLFPNAIAYDDNLSVEDYTKRAGGYTQNADSARVIVAHRDGSFDDVTQKDFNLFEKSRAIIRPGDEILVLPKIDVKSRQITKDLTQILYQVAVSTKVVLGL